MKRNWKGLKLGVVAVVATLLISSCDTGGGGDEVTETDFTSLLSNQVEEVIIPTMREYQAQTGALLDAVNGFASSTDEANLTTLRTAYASAYLAYQAVAVHNYYATANSGLVPNTNLYPVDLDLLASLIESESYNFSTSAQERANGYPVLDYLLYGPEDVVTYFITDAKRLAYLQALVTSIDDRADMLVEQWTGSLQTNFVNNGGTALGSSVSTQLNETMVYYEVHIRENKVGIPIGRLGPNDTPIEADPTLIEGYYQALAEGNEDFTLALLRASIEEMEDLYLGENSAGTDAQGYDDVLASFEQTAVDEDVKAQFAAIYSLIDGRSSISGDDTLYQGIQALVTLYKSDLFSTLNVQDADGANDGD